MPKASDLTLDTYNSFLFKGSYGFGKTLAAASFALAGPIHISYFDKKKPVELLTFFTEERFGAKAKTILENIDYTIYGAHNVHEYVNRIIDCSKNGTKYIADITDSVTTLTASAVNWSLGFRDPNKQRKDKLNKDAPALIPDFDEYKVETSLISQCMDMLKTLNCHVIWIAHPLPSIKIEGTGNSVKITKSNPIVTYGSKVAGMIPGGFTEIYHFSQQTEYSESGSRKKYIVSVDSVGDEFAKSPLLGDKISEFDITNRLFYEVWREQLEKVKHSV